MLENWAAGALKNNKVVITVLNSYPEMGGQGCGSQWLVSTYLSRGTQPMTIPTEMLNNNFNQLIVQ